MLVIHNFSSSNYQSTSKGLDLFLASDFIFSKTHSWAMALQLGLGLNNYIIYNSNYKVLRKQMKALNLKYFVNYKGGDIFSENFLSL